MEVEFPAIFPPVLALIGLHCKMLGKIQTLSGKLLLLHLYKQGKKLAFGIWCLHVRRLVHQMLLDCVIHLVWHEQSSHVRFGHYNVYDSKNLQQLHKAPQLFEAHGLINMLSCCLFSWRTRTCSWAQLYIIEESSACSGLWTITMRCCIQRIWCFRFLDSLNEISALTKISMKMISEKPVCCK